MGAGDQDMVKDAKMWWSASNPPEFDKINNINKAVRYMVFKDVDVRSTVDAAAAWVLEQKQ